MNYRYGGRVSYHKYGTSVVCLYHRLRCLMLAQHSSAIDRNLCSSEAE